MRAPPPLDLICKWIVDAWAGVSTDVIKKSFQACGISLSLCGGQDNEISVFKTGRQRRHVIPVLKSLRNGIGIGMEWNGRNGNQE